MTDTSHALTRLEITNADYAPRFLPGDQLFLQHVSSETSAANPAIKPDDDIAIIHDHRCLYIGPLRHAPANRQPILYKIIAAKRPPMRAIRKPTATAA
ncbi:MAG: hypothetical protein ABID63_18435 [Pseudomonadota bacterium]